MTRLIDASLRSAGLPALERSAWIEVDIDVLTANANALTSYSEPTHVGAVVKADGYGHGLEMAARCAVAGGAKWLCVADSSEATRLRRDGYAGRTFVLYPVPPAVLSTMARLQVDVTVGGVEEAKDLARSLDSNDPTLAVHLEIDTGMTRGGVTPDDTLAAASSLADGKGTKLVGVWTHLAAPEDPATTRAQLARFESALTLLASAGIETEEVHAAASGGLLAVDTAAHTLVRPGLAFYGIHPGAGGPLPPQVAPALAVKAHPVRIVEVSPGTSIGYAGTWTTDRPSVVATLPIGYADGWARSSSPGTSVIVEGKLAPIVGRVSSDSLTVDVTDIANVKPDSEFTLLGKVGNDVVTADAVAEARGTISWEVLQQLGSRLSRVYISASETIAIRPESTTHLTTAPGVSLPSYAGRL